VVAYAKSIINIIVQFKRSVDGKRSISEIYFDVAQKGERVNEKSYADIHCGLECMEYGGMQQYQ
jgi:hypothetical protein